MKQPLSLELSLKYDRFMRTMPKILLCVALAFMIMFVLAVWMIIKAPVDYQHGATGKILYIHVPSAWLATLCYTWMTGCALIVIFRREAMPHPSMADYCLTTAAPIGAIFTALTLATGSFWGRPAWGVWWVWDARLTSVFILFLLYLTIIAFYYIGRERKATLSAGAILTLFGFVLVPIIKFSAQWWQALHQPTSLWRSEGSAIEAAMLIPLIVMAFAFLLFFIVLQLLALRARLLAQPRHVGHRDAAVFGQHQRLRFGRKAADLGHYRFFLTAVQTQGLLSWLQARFCALGLQRPTVVCSGSPSALAGLPH